MARLDRDMPDGVKTPTSFSTVDEQTKAKAKSSALAAAAKAAQEADLQAAEDAYYTKKDSQGKTQAQTGKVVTMAKGTTTSNLDNEIDTVVDNGDGTITTTYKSGRKVTNRGYNPKGDDTANKKVYTASDGTEFTDQQAYVDYEVSLRESNAQNSLIASQNKAERRSAYDLLLSEFKNYGLEALVTPLKSLIEEGVSPSEFTLRLRETDAYKKRFAANAQRVAKGLRALSEAEYIGTEDQYQDVMRRYGMPETYYTKGELGVQSGFEKFLAGDVSAVELEDRIQTAQNRVVNSNPEVAKALKEFYPGISNGDILAYVLDPTNAIEQIKRKVTAAEIGGAAIQSGLQTGMTRAEELAAAGITKQQAQQGFQTIAEVAPRGGQLAEIYKQSPYTQTTAEQEVFGLAGATEAAKQRKKLTQLETAAFSGSAGQGAIARDRAGAY
ncbi:MAG: hypothetical protein EBU08_08240 [Micrococcales bacterium]|nr:hypothetical protein [Micrococcales bacterium]